MCILFEQENKQRNRTLNYSIPNPSKISLIILNLILNVHIYNLDSDTKLSSTYGVSNSSLYMSKYSKQSSSYGSSFSENISLIGNQIQLNQQQRQDSTELNKINDTKNFVLKFSEQDLKE